VAVSYQVNLAELATGQGLEAVVIGAAAPTGGSGFVEVRIDQTAAVTDPAGAVNPRALKRGEVIQMLEYLIQAIIRDTSLNQ
jgi:hypothetical protein